jgi:hypothetical protein
VINICTAFYCLVNYVVFHLLAHACHAVSIPAYQTINETTTTTTTTTTIAELLYCYESLCMLILFLSVKQHEIPKTKTRTECAAVA